MSEWPVLLICGDEATQTRVAGLLRERGYEAILLRSRAEAMAALARADPRSQGTSFASSEALEPAGAPRGPGDSVMVLRDIARKAAQEAERHAILRMLERTHWSRVRTAKLLSISYRTLLYKMKVAGLGRTGLGARSRS